MTVLLIVFLQNGPPISFPLCHLKAIQAANFYADSGDFVDQC